MFRTTRRLWFCAAALVFIASACAAAQGIELTRVQRSDVNVLPGAGGYLHPLTGVVSYTPQDWLNRPLLAIKVGNSGAERPQSGLDRADVIYEELVEGGVTRFIAIFSTNQAQQVGPVRSVRSVDPDILRPMEAAFGYSGGVPPTISKLRQTPGVSDVGADRVPGAYRREGGRPAPYNLYTSTDRLWNAASGGPPSEPQFSFLEGDQDPAAGSRESANEISFMFAGNSDPIRFAYNGESGRYDRYVRGGPHMVRTGEGDVHLSFRNVLIQMVNVSAGDIIDRSGAATREIDVVGQGTAILFRDGHAFRGTWRRNSVAEPTQFVDAGGQPLRLGSGKTMVELVPAGRQVSVN